MRVLHINSVYPPKRIGGAEKSVALLAEAQARSGHEVFVACSSTSEEPWADMNGVKVRRLEHENRFWQEDWPAQSRVTRAITKFEEGYNFRLMRRFGEVFDEVKPDLVNTHSMVALTPLVWRLARHRGVPVVHTLRDFDVMCARSSLFRSGRVCERRCWSCKLLTAPKQRSVRFVDAVVGNSRDTLNRHLDAGYFTHVLPDLRRVIWTIVDRQTSEHSQRILQGPITFGFMGRISQEKGLATLIAACRRLPQNGWRLVVAGNVPERHDFLPDLGSGLPVEFLGWVKPDVFFEQIDLLVVPSVWAEPLARVIIEAFAHGVPVLGSGVGGTIDLIGPENSDWLFDPSDSAALADKLRRILVQGRPIVFPRHTIEKVLKETRSTTVVEHYDSIYHALLARGR